MSDEYMIVDRDAFLKFLAGLSVSVDSEAPIIIAGFEVGRVIRAYNGYAPEASGELNYKRATRRG